MAVTTARTQQISIRLPHEAIAYLDTHGNRSAFIAKLIRRAQRAEQARQEADEMLAAGDDGDIGIDPDWLARNAARTLQGLD
ncbi:hypothetical protein FHX74_003096 [Friedmanniella endophytica]|uniref:Uncharacterized protein n=1 Tax=Microlunatus kandeliicorticis TaxID=1759536 RepID=A0A7W3IUP5_9ACTN|nr:hypothetical protein [Microlunatus kandeliicorticis]MBA8795460.1 hypothetical protein [Microlunatus kandeliicorticis]